MSSPKSPVSCVLVFAICCFLILFWLYVMTLVNPHLPDYHWRVICKVLDMRDADLLGVPALVGLVASVLFLMAYLVVYLTEFFKRK